MDSPLEKWLAAPFLTRSHHYAQVIDAVDLSAIQRHFALDEPFDQVWNHEDVQRLLRDLIQRKQEQLSAYRRYQSILGEWHDFIEWVNDLLPSKNHIMVSIEDSVPNFVHRLWNKYFEVETIYRRDQSPLDVISGWENWGCFAWMVIGGNDRMGCTFSTNLWTSITSCLGFIEGRSDATTRYETDRI